MDELRATPRYKTNRPAKISLAGGGTVACMIRDLSTLGARIELGEPIKLPDKFVLAIDSMGVRHHCHVAWRAANVLGVYFE